MKIKFTIPKYVQKVARILSKEGYDVYLVGGAIRDIVMGKTPHDFDLATNALPDEMLELFPKAVSTGAKFGTVIALVADVEGENKEVEVTTFRSEAEYIDGRWPSKVEFVNDLDKDLGRRDFTINAMALDLSSDLLDGQEVEREWDIHDPFSGITDINMKLIRAVGTPIERFKEDGLRAFKACRLASQLDFEIEEETFSAIKESLPVAKQVSMERVRDEFMKLLLNSPKPSKGIELMRQTGLLNIFLPELLEGYGVEQKLFHAHDVYTHSIRTCDFAEDSVKLAALLHDIAKPRTDMGNGHFYGHDVVGAKITAKLLERLKFPKDMIENVVKLVRYHMFFYNVGEVTESSVRRLMANVGKDNMEDLIKVREADRIGSGVPKAFPYRLRHLLFMIDKVRHDPVSPKMLKIDGAKVMEITNLTPSPKVGQILNVLLEEVIDDPEKNTEEYLENRTLELNDMPEAILITMSEAAKNTKEEFEEGVEQDIKKKHRV